MQSQLRLLGCSCAVIGSDSFMQVRARSRLTRQLTTTTQMLFGESGGGAEWTCCRPPLLNMHCHCFGGAEWTCCRPPLLNMHCHCFAGVCGVDVLLTTQFAAHAHRLRCHCPCSTCIAIALLEQCASEFLCLNRHRLAQNASLRVNGCVRRSSIAWHVMPRFEPMAAHTAAASPGTKCLASHQ